MNRPEKPARIIERSSIKTPHSAWLIGLAGILLPGPLACQVVGGLEELRLVEGGTAGSGGSGGQEIVSVASSTSSASSSSSGTPIMGDVACGMGTCPIGAESACCSDHYQTNSSPFVECVKGPPGNDGCNTAGGANGYETRIKCQIPAHCPTGMVCCGNLDTIAVATWYTTLSCATTCTWPDTIVCDPMNPNNDCPIVNEAGNARQTICTVSDLLPPGYSVCK
jgi:hypothetical protein